MLLLFVNCQKENPPIEDLEQDLKTQKSTTKTVSASDIPEVMNFIATKSSDYKFLLDDSATYEGMNFGPEDNLVMTELITDEITQATNAYAKSNYTFKLIKQSSKQDGKYFLNLVVKEYKDTFYLYIVKYVPDENWLSTHSITKDFGDFTGMIYYYSDQGIYVANATMQSGSSIASERNSCYDDTDGGIDIPDDDGGGGGSGCTLTIEWYQCNGTNAGIPHPPGGSGLPNSCNAQNGPQTGSGYNMIWTNCVGDRSMNDFLRQPCDGSGGASGGGTSSCQPDPNNPCEIPYTLDENCDCVFADAIENNDVVVVTPNYGKDINICLGTSFDVNTLNANPTIDQLYNYVFDDFGNCNPENPEFAELAAEALLEGGEFDEEENIIYSLSDYPCQKEIIENAIELSSIFTNLIRDTFESENANINILAEELTGAFANTSPFISGDPENFTISIRFDPVSLNESTDLGLVSGILHELVHAYLLSLYTQGDLAADSDEFSDLLDAFVEFFEVPSQETFEELDNENHNAFYYFITQMSESLFAYTQANDNLSDVTEDYCEKLMWGTMTGTNLFEEILTVDEQIENNNIAATEQGNLVYNNPKGTVCEN